jgi:hypothetical protein
MQNLQEQNDCITWGAPVILKPSGVNIEQKSYVTAAIPYCVMLVSLVLFMLDWFCALFVYIKS